MTPGLGRRHRPDDRDAGYRMTPAQLPPAPDVPYRYWWNLGARLDQGPTGTCVAHGWVHLAENSPITRPGTLDPYQLYREIVLLDEWAQNDGEATGPNEGMQFGTSVRAGAKALQARGLIGEYQWAWDLETAVAWIHRAGPLVIGVNWYEGMLGVDGEGFLHPTGRWVGGHAVELDGVNLDREVVRGLNSWGTGWGRKGTFWLTFEALERLLSEDGEACMAMEVSAG